MKNKYALTDPQPGDIVRINLKLKCFVEDDLFGTKFRDYFLTIWPDKDKVEKDTVKMYDGGEYERIILPSRFSVNLAGKLTWERISFDAATATFVKPTMKDMLEFGELLRRGKYKYDRKSKRTYKI